MPPCMACWAWNGVHVHGKTASSMPRLWLHAEAGLTLQEQAAAIGFSPPSMAATMVSVAMSGHVKRKMQAAVACAAAIFASAVFVIGLGASLPPHANPDQQGACSPSAAACDDVNLSLVSTLSFLPAAWQLSQQHASPASAAMWLVRRRNRALQPAADPVKSIGLEAATSGSISGSGKHPWQASIPGSLHASA